MPPHRSPRPGRPTGTPSPRRPSGPRPGGPRPGGPRPGGPRPGGPRPGGRAPAAADDGKERLQKLLASAGLGSRRSCEELITAGRVEVDRQVVTELGVRVDPLAQEIRVDGERLPDPKRVVYVLYKPVGVVTTNYDPTGRPRVVDLVPGERRLFAVGRLDRTSEGLILVTNDGDLANLLAHPRYGVEKKYLVQVAGVPSPDLLEKLRRGVRLAEGEVHAKRVTLRSQHKQSAVLEMVLDEGKNREIRRMLAKLGHKVQQLKRVAVGGLSLGNLLPGQWRQLSWAEVEAVKRETLAAAGTPGGPGRAGPRSPRPPAGRRQPPRAPAKAVSAGRRKKRPGKASAWRAAGKAAKARRTAGGGKA